MNNNVEQFFLQGNYAPWHQENNLENIASIIGKIPKELNGVLYRNGPNPQFCHESKHWFEGDGMLHMFAIRDSKVSYCNRWIRTERFNLERQAGRFLFKGFAKIAEIGDLDVSGNTANTNIIQYAGRLLALEEQSCPIEIDPKNLNTLGNCDFEGKVPQMSAHPHFNAGNEMHNFAYTPDSNEIQYYIFDREGRLAKSETFDAPFSSFMHDFFITQDYAIFPAHPVTFNMKRLQQGKPFLMWEPELGSHIGIVPHTGNNEDVVWFEMEAHHVFHYMNGYQEGHKIILDGMKSKRAGLFPDSAGNVPAISDFPSRLTRWIFDLEQKKVTEEQIDACFAEFPRFDERFTGLPYRHGYVAAISDLEKASLGFDSIIHYDHKNKRQTCRLFPDGQTVSEPIFVPRNEYSQEGDGYLLVVVYAPHKDSSDLYILDARNIDQEPVAIVQLPHRIPNGFHGNWYSNL